MNANQPDLPMQMQLIRKQSEPIDALQNLVFSWAERAFPHRTDASMFLKLYGEVAELIDAGDDCGDEIADLMILLLDYATRKGVLVGPATMRKLEINMTRVWEETAMGTYQHV
jgi:NTP pyrophosphatase (non-canonical NTP hydrolase)